MDPFTVALAVFGVSKLTGSSTKNSVRNALLAAGGTQLAGMGGLGPFKAFGKTSIGSGTGKFIPGSGQTTGQLMTQLKNTTAGSGIEKLIGFPNKIDPKTNEIIPGSGEGFRGLGTAGKLGVGAAGISLLAGMGDDEQPIRPLGMSDEDYAKALEEARTQVSSITRRAAPPPQISTSPYNYDSGSLYTFNKGGIVSRMPKYSSGGINYLPSKITHDENDLHNYVRATGYVEDGSGSGDKDEDTILAQLADGEFVLRSDAVLGAGILEGASPKNYKEMRKKGAVYFYNQQAQLKRVFDLLDASEKVN